MDLSTGAMFWNSDLEIFVEKNHLFPKLFKKNVKSMGLRAAKPKIFLKVFVGSAERGRPAKGRGKLKLSPLDSN